MADAPRRPPGTLDVLPPESKRWEALLGAFAGVVERAGYGLVLTPTFEELAVFSRVGESTDIVRKEMYEFEDKGGRRLALRPEMTASVARAYLEHRPPAPWKVWSAGANFRYERAQAGRYREFHQVDLEAFGSADPDLDVEVVALGWEFFARLGLRRLELLLNSLGDGTCRPPYRKLLLDYLLSRREALCAEHRGRIEANPLRVLDCKDPACQAVVETAPRQLEHLCEPCASHFARVRAGLESLGVPYRIETRLVRGLDYYTRTTFEYAGLALESAQNALGGGGRYDGLVEELGGPATPAIGFALGIERTLLACDAEGLRLDAGAPLDVFVVDLTGGGKALALTASLRQAGLRADRAFDGRSARAQFRMADRSGARLAVVVGPEEAASGQVGIKDLRAGAGAGQERVDAGALVEEVRRRLGSP